MGRLCFRGLALAVIVCAPQVATAQSFEDCEKREIAIIRTAIEGAHDLALQAAVSVGDTPEYRRWFGDYTRHGADAVRRDLKTVYKALAELNIHNVCVNTGLDGCKGDTYAYIYRSEAWTIHYCRPFFGLPSVLGISPSSSDLEYGTIEGTIIHELSHFDQTAGTEDFCYSRTDCARMAQRDPNSARRNADSLQYYSEDVLFFGGSG
ncbi:protease [Ponticoccus sp. SC2-23]|uniref:M35 family metallo-endopeptidase n=1 Tax=Alexandriicola marinus TaxID=2081710 RepID=UPI000FD99F19|nr:M35 family metallo-endopeptidase [Alexandriicola marinus]MBM1222257.1 protease [Ponticoccus sp. SC6-9]MBM1224370.1 protease [Ponticoccus sp. SC6-15]MBM1229850.1 protease [Ponticoccus sp. SC6-38]MBM1233336.1 protease [Ponticoccus sp. SC6-45]MBM1236714.1 protease [Ponticoccus sp. SC6-49]MBM1244758.1 protease [Ponticoccus sp. SC2-64]MBM1246860.1 protease [Ponticoccus sp. SC6-42]MBM1251338.1 protease [Ponticoccus sp. SC6-33]MBM1254723.1 protease [Ponticoccus sp. SC6-60]MBM1259229.1 proteas